MNEIVTMLDLYVQPGARRAGVRGIHGGRIKISVAVPPVEGLANEALIEFLSERLRIPRSDITIFRGESSRLKTLKIIGLTSDQIDDRLL